MGFLLLSMNTIGSDILLYMPGHTCIVLGSLVSTSHGFVWDDAYVWDGGSCMHLPLANASEISHTSKIWNEGERKGGVPPPSFPPRPHTKWWMRPLDWGTARSASRSGFNRMVLKRWLFGVVGSVSALGALHSPCFGWLPTLSCSDFPGNQFLF